MPNYVNVSGADHARLADAADKLVRFEGNLAFMHMVDGHCAALAYDAGSQEWRCGTYETRPQTCRDLERGSSACEAEREAKAERPHQLLLLQRR
jgi:uncharacterized protein